jgi:hypothetical protein
VIAPEGKVCASVTYIQNEDPNAELLRLRQEAEQLRADHAASVLIARDIAQQIAAWLRMDGGAIESGTIDAWADLLDPRPALREDACRRLTDAGYGEIDRRAVDIVTATVRDHIAALFNDGGTHRCCRNKDILALLDGA